MSDLISRKALVHGLMENYEKCMTFDGLLKYIHGQPTAYDVDKVVEMLESEKTDTGMKVFDDCTNRAINKAIEIVKGAVKDEEEKCKFCRCARCRWQATYNCLHYRRPPCSWCGSKGNMKHSDIVGQCKGFVKRMEE